MREVIMLSFRRPFVKGRIHPPRTPCTLAAGGALPPTVAAWQNALRQLRSCYRQDGPELETQTTPMTRINKSDYCRFRPKDHLGHRRSGQGTDLATIVSRTRQRPHRRNWVQRSNWSPGNCKSKCSHNVGPRTWWHPRKRDRQREREREGEGEREGDGERERERARERERERECVCVCVRARAGARAGARKGVTMLGEHMSLDLKLPLSSMPHALQCHRGKDAAPACKCRSPRCRT